jgi:large subunit ribosomal protein L1
MANTSKRMKAIRSEITSEKSSYSFQDAVDLLKRLSRVKFDESVDVSINLSLDKKESNPVFRGALVLPNSIGRVVRVAVFAQGQQAEAALKAGADVVGLENLAESMKGGDLNYQVVIATPDTMPIVAPLGQLLGPKNLMPNPKLGTVTQDVAHAVLQAKAGQVRYKADKAGIVHLCIGKLSFDSRALLENFKAVLTNFLAKKTNAKALFKKITLSSTMGPGLMIDLSVVHTLV